VLGGEVVVPKISKISSFFSQKKKVKGLPPPDQMRLCGNAVDPSAVTRVSVAIADFVHSHCLPFSLATDPKLMKVIEEARSLGGGYTPPNRNQMSGPLLDRLYEASWNEQMKTILCEARIFGVSVFGDGATIKSVPLVNVLAAGVNNPFALLDIHDCTAHMASGGKKDAKYIAEVVQPMITKMESEVNVNRVQNKGIVDMVFFDGASNVQNTGKICKQSFLTSACAMVQSMLYLSSYPMFIPRYVIVQTVRITFCHCYLTFNIFRMSNTSTCPHSPNNTVTFRDWCGIHP
jgi:hypothetical protein